jgi:glycosyltransferase involved in cell wall biosynthesis
MSIKNLSHNSPKIAIFYDWLNQWGGAEKVLLNLLTLYPQAELFTLVYDPKKTKWLPKNIKIHTSFLQKLPLAKNNFPLYTPIYDLALEQFDFTKFDIVISTTSNLGHCLLTLPSTLFLCYYHNINRHLYSPKNTFLKPLLKIYQKLDLYYSTRPDFSFCNSQTVQKRLINTYQKNAQIINPGIDTKFFKLSSSDLPLTGVPQKYYLSVSRLVRHKKVDLTIKACIKLNKNLIVVGQGRDENRLKKLARNHPNIIFIKTNSDIKLRQLYQNAQALICPQIEDFGLAPLESLACGIPVIALKKGGFTETLTSEVAQFFKHQTVTSLSKAITKFETKLTQNYFSKIACLQQATQFSASLFMLNFKQIIDQLWINWNQKK